MDWAADIVYVSPLLRLIPNELIYNYRYYIHVCPPPPPKNPKNSQKNYRIPRMGEKDSPLNITSKVLCVGY